VQAIEAGNGVPVAVPEKRGSVGFLLVSFALVFCAGAGAAWTVYVVYSVFAGAPDVTGAVDSGLRARVGFDSVRAAAAVVPMSLLTIVVALGSIATFVHRAAFARGNDRRPIGPVSLFMTQAAFLLTGAALLGLVATLVATGASQHDVVRAGAGWLPSLVVALVLAALLRRPPLRPSLRRALAVLCTAGVLAGGATIAQAGTTSSGQPIVAAGFRQVSYTGVSSVQLMRVTCANVTDCVGEGLGTYGANLPNTRSLLAISSDGARTWQISALPVAFSLPLTPTCYAYSCTAAYREGPSGRSPGEDVLRILFSTDGSPRVLSLGLWRVPTVTDAPLCTEAECLVAGGGPPLSGAQQHPASPVIWRSGDGGRDWKPVELPLPPSSVALDGTQGPWCSDTSDCVAAVQLFPRRCEPIGENGQCQGTLHMALTNDGGRTWSLGAQRLPFSAVSCGVGGVCTGTVERGSSVPQTLFATSGNFGTSWGQLRKAPDSPGLTCWSTEDCVAFFLAMPLRLSGWRVNVAATTNDGRSWQPQNVSGETLEAVQVPWCDAQGNCIAVAAGGPSFNWALTVARRAKSSQWTARPLPLPSKVLSVPG